MGLIINQGVQDTSKDTNFDLMVSDQEVAQVTKVELDQKNSDRLVITMRIISEGEYKGRLVWDRVAYRGEYSWTYRNFRKAAGVPYKDGEGEKVDIEKILLNKAVNVKLNIRKANDGNEYQDVKYIMAPVQQPKEVVEDELPFEYTDTTDDLTEW